MIRRATCLGLLAALGGCTDRVVLNDYTVVDAAVADGAIPPVDSGEAHDSRFSGTGIDAMCRSIVRYPRFAPQAAQVMIVLDRSAAMQASLQGTSSKEAAAQSALLDAIQKYQGAIWFGIEQFPVDPKTNNCSSTTCCAGPVNDPQPNAYQFISSLLQCFDPQGCQSGSTDSPSHAALSEVRDFFYNRLNSSLTSKGDTYALLVTTSEPSCSSDHSSVDPCHAAIGAATDLGKMDIPVVVLSVGYQPDSNPYSCLWSLSKVGTTSGTMPGGASRLYDAMSMSDLKGALSDLLTPIAQLSCTLTTNDNVPPDAVLNVSSGGTPVSPAKGPSSDGWSFANNQLQLQGSACDQFLSQGPTLTVTYVTNDCAPCSDPGSCWP